MAGTSLVKLSLGIPSLDVQITDSPDLYGPRLNRSSLDGLGLKGPRDEGQYHDDPSLVKAQWPKTQQSKPRRTNSAAPLAIEPDHPHHY